MEGGIRFLEFEVDGESVMIALEHITKIKEHIKSNGDKQTIIRSVDGTLEVVDMNYEAVKKVLKYAEER